jgi:hypothetical protein
MNLIKEMEKRLPIPAYPSKELCKVFRNQGVTVDLDTELQITRVGYSGDTGGIVCTIEKKGKVFAISLTYLRIKPDHPLGKKILAYQKQRVKRLSHERSRNR